MRLFRKVQAGTIHFELPLPEGQTVEIIVLPVDEEGNGDFSGLAESGLTFWDNETDDRVWNDAVPPT